MHITNLRKIGNSVALAVRPAILERLHLRLGATVGIAVEGRLLVEPQRPCYTLDELLAQCDASLDPDDEERAWVDSDPVGLELL